MRKLLPPRRRCVTSKVKIEGHTFYLTCGEYEDGSLGEIFIDAAKQGTFTNGILDTLARVSSIALQYGTPVEAVCEAMQGLNFPPKGNVQGTETVDEVSSVVDWIACELRKTYTRTSENPEDTA